MTTLPVRYWPSYLLDLPPELREKIEESAKISGESMSEIIRQALCSQFIVHCDPVEASSSGPQLIRGTERMILRLQPELFDEIKRQAESGLTMRSLVLDALYAHYREDTQ
jgi:hypothetical protein